MKEVFEAICEMLDEGRNPLDISGELNVPDSWVQAAIQLYRAL